MSRFARRLGIVTTIAALAAAAPAHAHQNQPITYTFDQNEPDPAWGPLLYLSITDEATNEPTPARFSVIVDGEPYFPDWLGTHGLRFVSIHVGKRQRFVVTYARGSGDVEIPLPNTARRVEIHAVKGLDYLPASTVIEVSGEKSVRAVIALRRWNSLEAEGWAAAEEHIHYDRIEPAGDRDWLTMMAADGLAHAHFMVLKGGNKQTIWAEQFAYGPAGHGSDGQRLVVPGEEYRDRYQGHINLLGVSEVIQPIMAGVSDWPYNYPLLHDVLLHARRLGGVGGVAHGARGQTGTAVADAVLGAMDFWEIGNTHLYEPYVWYRLLNCGVILPPVGGTDLPNNPAREIWQPFLGGIRTYVKMGDDRSFESWKRALKRGEVFVSSGPIIQFRVNSVEGGGVVRLPASGGEVTIEAELAGPRALRTLQVLKNAEPIDAEVQRTFDGDIHAWRIVARLRIDRSCWLAAHGVGARIPSIKIDAIAHSSAVQVLVGDQPITSPDDASKLIEQLTQRRAFYLERGRYEKPEHRQQMTDVFDRAIGVLRRQTP